VGLSPNCLVRMCCTRGGHTTKLCSATRKDPDEHSSYIITAPARAPSGLRLVISSRSDANVVTCWEADLAMSPAAAVAWLTAAWPRSPASPTEFFTESTASSAVSVIVALGCRKCRRSRSVGLERGIHEVLLLSVGAQMKRCQRCLFRGHFLRFLVDHRLGDLGERSVGCLFLFQRLFKQRRGLGQSEFLRPGTKRSVP
jgi:hypothetical protein